MMTEVAADLNEVIAINNNFYTPVASGLIDLIQACHELERLVHPIMSRPPHRTNLEGVNYNLLCYTGGRLRAPVGMKPSERDIAAPVYNLHY